MAAPSVGPSGSTPNGLIPSDWPVQAADTIVETISKVRDRTTKPALVAARGLVYGLMGLLVGTVAAIVALILVVRLYANYAPGNVWPLYAGLSVVMIVAGLVLLKKAAGPAKNAS